MIKARSQEGNALVLGVVVVVILVIAIGGYYMSQQSETDVQPADSNGDAMMNDGDAMKDDDAMMADDDAMHEGDSMEGDAMKDGDAMEAASHTFDIGGVDFAFTQREIRVKKGDTVTINFTSNDGFHDWVVDEFDAATEQVTAGKSTSVTFVADTAGTFEYYCSVGKHRELGMVGNLVVEG